MVTAAAATPTTAITTTTTVVAAAVTAVVTPLILPTTVAAVAVAAATGKSSRALSLFLYAPRTHSCSMRSGYGSYYRDRRSPPRDRRRSPSPPRDRRRTPSPPRDRRHSPSPLAVAADLRTNRAITVVLLLPATTRVAGSRSPPNYR